VDLYVHPPVWVKELYPPLLTSTVFTSLQVVKPPVLQTSLAALNALVLALSHPVIKGSNESV